MIHSFKRYIVLSISIFLLTSCAVNKKLISVNNFNSHTYTPQAKPSLLKSIITNDSIDQLTLTKAPIFAKEAKIPRTETTKTSPLTSTNFTRETTAQEIKPIHKNKTITIQPEVKKEELPMSTNAILGFVFTTVGALGFIVALFFMSNPVLTLSLLIFLPIGKVLRILGAKEIKTNKKRGKGFIIAGRILGYTITSALITSLILLYLLASNLER